MLPKEGIDFSMQDSASGLPSGAGTPSAATSMFDLAVFRRLSACKALCGRLVQKCHFRDQWIANSQRVKSHVRRSHADYWARFAMTAELLARQHSHMLDNSGQCAVCGLQVQ